MRICWDNLEGIVLNSKGNFNKGHSVYIEKDACGECGEPYLTLKCRTGRYCSKTCANSTWSKEARRKLSERMKNENNPFWGKKHSSKTRQRISKTKIEKELKGKKNGRYINGRSSSTAYLRAKCSERIAMKLNQTPQDANHNMINFIYEIASTMADVDVDHIKPLSKGGLHHEDNLQILSSSLNRKKSAKWPLTFEEEKRYEGLRICRSDS